MTEEIIIDVTKCDFNTFDGGGSQRTICTLDNCYCDGIRVKDCYYKQLKRLEQENEILKKKLDLAVGRATTNCEAAEKYWAVLEEIREIADIIYNTNCNWVIESKKILDKINEALNLS